MQATRLQDGKSWVLVFRTGDKAIDGLQRFAAEQGLGGSQFSAIGAFRHTVLGYFDWGTKEFRRNVLDEQMEVAALNGFITASDAGPTVHAHVVLGRSDGLAYAGHLLEGEVRPTLELIINESPSHLCRRLDPESGIALIDLRG